VNSNEGSSSFSIGDMDLYLSYSYLRFKLLIILSAFEARDSAFVDLM